MVLDAQNYLRRRFDGRHQHKPQAATCSCSLIAETPVHLSLLPDAHLAECAAGFAGKGQDGQCKKCPAGTDIAEGGPMGKSVCLKCPKGSFVNSQGSDCLCPAGHFRVTADQPAGYKKIACQPCQARNAYVPDERHAKEACALCRIPMVANKDHSDCGKGERRLWRRHRSQPLR